MDYGTPVNGPDQDLPLEWKLRQLKKSRIRRGIRAYPGYRHKFR